MYLWAVAILAGLAALKLLLWSDWLALLVEAVSLLMGCGLVLVRRIRYGLWGRMDEAMTELMNLARAKAFDLMGWTSIAAMLLGFILDERNLFMYEVPCIALSYMRGHVQTRCIREGWLHGLIPHPRGWAAILRALAIFLIGTAMMVGVYWLKAGQRPETWLIVMSAGLMALVALCSLSGKSMRESEAAADAALEGAERWAERAGADEE